MVIKHINLEGITKLTEQQYSNKHNIPLPRRGKRENLLIGRTEQYLICNSLNLTKLGDLRKLIN